MSKLTVLDVEFEVLRPEVIHPIMMEDENDLILFDCGYPTFSQKLKEAAKRKGIDFDRLTKIVITHQDYDHMGALAELAEQYPNVEVMASDIEAPYISGEQLFLRQQMFVKAPPDTTTRRYQRYALINQMYGELKPARVDRRLHDGEHLPFCGGLRVILTPGHMPGHISIYSEEHKTLITGDALVLRNDHISYSDPTFSLDHDAAKRAVDVLIGIDIHALACYHGGYYKGDIKNEIMQLRMKDPKSVHQSPSGAVN